MKKIGSVSGGVERDALRKARDRPVEQLLYVEDDDDNWQVAQLRLGSAYELIRARDASQACRVLVSQGRSLTAILMDIGLSGSDLNGVELTGVIRGKLPRERFPEYTRAVPVLTSTPIIFVTAHGAKYSDAMLTLAGGDRVISKPVDFAELNLALTQLTLARLQQRNG